MKLNSTMRALLALGLWILPSPLLQAQQANQMFKNPGCACCDQWAEHMAQNGFTLESSPTSRMNELKAHLGIPEQVKGCHTSVIDGLIVEGHVPADLVQRVLRERPEGIVGVAVPGMPMGSPGMEGPRKDDYPVVLFDSSGAVMLYEMR
jgi:hypothetical protein